MTIIGIITIIILLITLCYISYIKWCIRTQEHPDAVTPKRISRLVTNFWYTMFEIVILETSYWVIANMIILACFVFRHVSIAYAYSAMRVRYYMRYINER